MNALYIDNKMVCHYISLSQKVIVSNPIDLRKNNFEIKIYQNKMNLGPNEVKRNKLFFVTP